MQRPYLINDSGVIQMTSVIEYNAKIQALDVELAKTRFELKERQVTREKRKVEFENLEDRLLNIALSDKQVDVSIAETRSQGKQMTLEQTRSELKYLDGKHTLQRTQWALELATTEIQIAGSKQRLEEMRQGASILNQAIDTRISGLLGGL
jgi:hypothetical protein